MSKQTVKRIHLAYGVVLSLLVVTVGVLLILSCLDIYQSGDRLFSRESMAEHFSAIALPVYLCLIWAIGGLVLSLALPLEKSKQKALVSPRVTLQRLTSRLDARTCPTDLAAGIRKQRTLRLVLRCANAALYLIGATLALIYVLNKNNFPAQNANEEILRGALAVGANLALPFLMSIALCFINKVSVKREIALVKQAIAAQAKDASIAPIDGTVSPHPLAKAKAFFIKHDKRILLVTRCTILFVGAALLLVGIWNGGASDVVQKAIKICTECIGLG